MMDTTDMDMDERPATRAGTHPIQPPRPTTALSDSDAASELVFSHSPQQTAPSTPESRGGGGGPLRPKTRMTTAMSDLIEEDDDGEYESEEDEDVFAFLPPRTGDDQSQTAPAAATGNLSSLAHHQQHQQEQQHALALSLVPQSNNSASSDPFFFQSQLAALPSLTFQPASSGPHTQSYPADIKHYPIPTFNAQSSPHPITNLSHPIPIPISLLPVESPPQTNSTASADMSGNMNNNSYRMRSVSMHTAPGGQAHSQAGHEAATTVSGGGTYVGSTPAASGKTNFDDRDIYTSSSSFYPQSRLHRERHMSYGADGSRSGMSSDGDGAGSIKMELDFDNLGIGGDEDEDSPYPEVRASVSNIDDPEMPALTFRMWTIGLFLAIIAGGANVFFNFRNPAPTIPPLVILLIAYPMGKFLAYSLPITTFKCKEVRLDSLPLIGRWPKLRGKVLGGWEFSLNPGPWNIKEHVLCYIMANVTVIPPYAMSMIVVSEMFYDINRGFGFNLVLIFATQLTGFGLAGLCRRFLVWPASMVWPQNLVVCTLLNTLHAEDDQIVPPPSGAVIRAGRQRGFKGFISRILTKFTVNGMSRYSFFLFVLVASFLWFWIPGFLWTGLSIFSWVCWIKPNNVVVNQLFGAYSGLGMGLITFDWTEITWVGSPLAVPWWAECHVFLGFVLVYWILTPLLYYTNVWDLAYLPISNLIPYDNQGQPYSIHRILNNDTHTFNEAAYLAYSPLYLPATYAMTYLLAFALSTCVLVHTMLYHGRSLLNGAKKITLEPDDIHAKLMRNYPEVPDVWYASVFTGFFVLAIIMVEVWHTGVPVYILLVAVLLPLVYVLPSGFIFAMTGQSINLNLLAQIIPGSLLPGNPLVNMLFKSYSIQTLSESLSFTQDLKLGHYIKVPPRATFTVQLVATTLAAVVQIGVKTWMFANIHDICQPNQKSNLTCPHNQVFFTASAVWGLIGPSRQFGSSSIYHPQLYALAIGAVLPVPFWLWQRKFPGSRLKFVNIPVLLNGIGFIPPATGINYSAWFGMGFIFQYLVRRRYFNWWSKFNYVMSAGLDCGTLLCVLAIFFFVVWPTGFSGPEWWGNTVWRETADFKRTPFRAIPPGGIPPR